MSTLSAKNIPSTICRIVINNKDRISVYKYISVVNKHKLSNSSHPINSVYFISELVHFNILVKQALLYLFGGCFYLLIVLIYCSKMCSRRLNFNVLVLGWNIVLKCWAVDINKCKLELSGGGAGRMWPSERSDSGNIVFIQIHYCIWCE